VALALMGQRVVAMDGDIGLRNLDVVMGLESRVVYDLVDVVEGRCRLRQAMIKDKRLSELYLIPAAQKRDKTAVSPGDMIRVCDELRREFDFIFIDSPAGIERGFKNTVAPADEILIVTNPEVSAVRDADRIIGLVEAEEKPEPRLIINRLKPEMVRRGDMLDIADVLDILAIDLDRRRAGGRQHPGLDQPRRAGGARRAMRSGIAYRNIAGACSGGRAVHESQDEGGLLARPQPAGAAGGNTTTVSRGLVRRRPIGRHESSRTPLRP
jgi:septum site-determining protein MinD